MVKKLIKYEFRAFGRILFPVQAIVIGVGLLCRFVQLFETDGSTYSTFFGSSVAAEVIACLTCLGMTVAVAIMRFYKNLFTNEGYLSFTLPVKKFDHIISKLAVALIFSLGACVTVALSISAATLGDVLVELWRAVLYLAGEYFDSCGSLHGSLYIVEAFVLLIISLCSLYLKLYACVSIGQLAHKNRVLAAVGCYFGIFLFRQLLGTVGIVIMTKIDFESLFIWIGNHPNASVHLFLSGMILLDLIISAVYMLISKYIISRKLNLE